VSSLALCGFERRKKKKKQQQQQKIRHTLVCLLLFVLFLAKEFFSFLSDASFLFNSENKNIN
jgi:hypothetical protein